MFKHVIMATMMIVMLLPVGESKATDPLSLLNEAVLDWCDMKSGIFHLPHISAPSCEINSTIYLGTLKGIFGDVDAPDAAWWWKLREGVPSGFTIGVLWYIGGNPKELCAASQEMICPCSTALAALNNPAKVPVVLIGPGAVRCD